MLASALELAFEVTDAMHLGIRSKVDVGWEFEVLSGCGCVDAINERRGRSGET